MLPQELGLGEQPAGQLTLLHQILRPRLQETEAISPGEAIRSGSTSDLPSNLRKWTAILSQLVQCLFHSLRLPANLYILLGMDAASAGMNSSFISHPD